jgi:putative flavoprotein involved in K+ transport
MALVEAAFGQRMQVMLDAYIAAAGIEAPVAEPVPADDWQPSSSGARLDLGAEGITSVIWSTGYGLDFGFLDIPVLDEWNYPRHVRGVTEVPGLYAVGLPWLTKHASSTVAAVGMDAEYVVGHLAAR